jgi:hypothetical protein
MRPSLEFAKKKLGSQLIGVEVGVDIGENAQDMLDNWSEILYLHLVDVIDNIHDRFVSDNRVTFHHLPSIEATKKFQDNSFDFIYIDAHHSYESVTQDLNTWYPKLRVGGVICGHDFCYPDRDVGQAVIDFFIQKEIGLFIKHTDFWGVKT